MTNSSGVRTYGRSKYIFSKTVLSNQMNNHRTPFSLNFDTDSGGNRYSEALLYAEWMKERILLVLTTQYNYYTVFSFSLTIISEELDRVSHVCLREIKFVLPLHQSHQPFVAQLFHFSLLRWHGFFRCFFVFLAVYHVPEIYLYQTSVSVAAS